MNKSELTPIINLIVEGDEFVDAFKNANEDNRIRFLEWVNIAREGTDFFNAFKDFKGFKIQDVSDEDIEQIVIKMKEVLGDPFQISHNRCVNILKFAKYLTLAILDPEN